MYQGRHGGDCDERELYPPECTEGGIHTSHIATMSLEVHTTFCDQIGGKSRVACECVVSRGQSSFVRYEHFARWSGRYEHYRPLKRAVWTFRPILTPRHNWLHAALRTSMQCDFFRPFGHKTIYVIIFCRLLAINAWKCVWQSDGQPEDPLKLYPPENSRQLIIYAQGPVWKSNPGTDRDPDGKP